MGGVLEGVRGVSPAKPMEVEAFSKCGGKGGGAGVVDKLKRFHQYDSRQYRERWFGLYSYSSLAGPL